MSDRISLPGMLRLIRVNTLRRVHNVGIPVGRLICIFRHNYWYEGKLQAHVKKGARVHCEHVNDQFV